MNLEAAYLQLQLQMQRRYLAELLAIERLCVQLNILQRDNLYLHKIREMHLKHIRPLIIRLQVAHSSTKPRKQCADVEKCL